MAAPIRKVAPNGFQNVVVDITEALANAELDAGVPTSIQTSLSTFGTVISSTAPGSLTRCWQARAEIRRLAAVR